MKYKKNQLFSSKIFIILCLIFLIYCIFCWYKIAIKTKESQAWEKEQYTLCEEYQSLSSEQEKENFQNKNKEFNINNTTCEKISNSKGLPYSTYHVYYNFFVNNDYLFIICTPIIILFPFLYIISRELKNNVIKNYCLRKDYKEYIKYIFKTAYKNIFIIPIFVIITFIISYIISGKNLNPVTDQTLNLALPNIQFINNKVFPIVYFVTLLSEVGLYINIGLIVQSKTKNYIVALLESELFIFFIWCFSIIIFGNIGSYYFNLNPNNFNLMNLYTWHGIDNMYAHLIFNIILYLISLFLAIRSYTNKEKLINMCER